MARFSIAAFNKELEPHKLELVKGEGYFYFADTDANDLQAIRLKSTSVMTHAFKFLSPAQWRAEAKHIIDQIAQQRLDDAEADRIDPPSPDGILRLRIKRNI